MEDSCDSNPRGRGDIICSNLKNVSTEIKVKPCFVNSSITLTLSDHSIISSKLNLYKT